MQNEDAKILVIGSGYIESSLIYTLKLDIRLNTTVIPFIENQNLKEFDIVIYITEKEICYKNICDIINCIENSKILIYCNALDYCTNKIVDLATKTNKHIYNLKLSNVVGILDIIEEDNSIKKKDNSIVNFPGLLSIEDLCRAVHKVIYLKNSPGSYYLGEPEARLRSRYLDGTSGSFCRNFDFEFKDIFSI
jgi:hypothetical protein